MPLYLFLSFAFGAIIGSFLNVVVLRYGAKRLSGRSSCMLCGKTLRWHELVPLLSYLIQRGRCRGCKGRIVLQYILVETLTGLAFVLIAWKNLQPTTDNLQPDFSLLWWLVVGSELLVWSLLIALSVYDIRHKIIPNGLVYSAAGISLLLLVLSYLQTYNVQLTTYNFLSGFLFALPFAALWFFSRGRAIGLGDAKLILFFPWLLGLSQGLTALITGFWIGAAVSVALLLLKSLSRSFPRDYCPTLRAKLSRLSLKTELPLGPFLVLGLFLTYLLGWDVTGLESLLQSSF